MSKKLLSLFILVVVVLALLPAATLAAGGKNYTVQADDWLSKLAEKEYGDPMLYPAIAYYTNIKAATDKTFTRIDDANVLEVGWVIYLPTADEAKTLMDKIAKLGKVKIGTNAEYPPMESVDASGAIVGFDIDLMNAMAKASGFQIEFANTRWDGIFVALASGEFDAVASSATITAERKQTVDFSDPYFNAGQMIAVKEGSTIKTTADLDGKKVGVQLGTTGDIWVSQNTKAQVVRYDEITLAFQAMAQGDVDAVVNDGPVSADIIRANPEMKATLVGKPFTKELYGVAVNKAKPELLAALNLGLAKIKASGEYQTIYNKWFPVK